MIYCSINYIRVKYLFSLKRDLFFFFFNNNYGPSFWNVQGLRAAAPGAAAPPAG